MKTRDTHREDKSAADHPNVVDALDRIESIAEYLDAIWYVNSARELRDAAKTLRDHLARK